MDTSAGGDTVIAAVPDWPDPVSVAAMVAVPARIPVTTPDALTMAIAGADEV